MPARLPIQCRSTEASRSRAATARPGLVCPPVPPPDITISMRFRAWPIVLCGGPEMAPALPQAADNRTSPLERAARALPALEGEGNEAGDQLGVGDARGFPEPRGRARRGGARGGVDLLSQPPAAALHEG